MARVEIYSKRVCPYCQRAKNLLEHKEQAYDEYHVEEDANKLEEMLQRADGRKTVPQIFINNKHIGGFDDLSALESAGELDQLLTEEGA